MAIDSPRDLKPFEVLHAELRPLVLRYLQQMVPALEAEDLAQKTFLKVNDALSTFRGDSKLSTWILKIATNVAIDWMRAQRDDSAELASIAHIAAEEASAEQAVMKEEMARCIRARVERLPPHYRVAVSLADLKSLSHAEIAEILGIPIPLVKVRIHRGRKMLRADLQNHCCLYRNEDNELACIPKDRQDGSDEENS